MSHQKIVLHEEDRRTTRASSGRAAAVLNGWMVGWLDVVWLLVLPALVTSE